MWRVRTLTANNSLVSDLCEEKIVKYVVAEEREERGARDRI